MKRMNTPLLCVAMLAAFAPHAQAQMTWTDKGFVNVSGGFQGGSHTLSSTSTFDLYEELGTVSASQTVKGGGFFDLSGGYKVWRNLALGLGYSRTSSSADADVAATVPDPVVHDRLRPVLTRAPNLKHTESAVHLMGVWMVPVTDKIDVALSAGPTIFSVKQDVPGSLTVSEPGPTVAVAVTSPKKTSAGLNLGVDVTYMINPRFGVGGLARYTVGSVTLEGTSESLTVGGFQIGGGLRVRF